MLLLHSFKYQIVSVMVYFRKHMLNLMVGLQTQLMPPICNQPLKLWMNGSWRAQADEPWNMLLSRATLMHPQGVAYSNMACSMWAFTILMHHPWCNMKQHITMMWQWFCEPYGCNQQSTWHLLYFQPWPWIPNNPCDPNYIMKRGRLHMTCDTKVNFQANGDESFICTLPFTSM